ncbi:D-alanyl-D-alanine carboxypeptidase family protein [Thalassobacillus sp. CUG 92003]|uniref:M15 family metallopeptidase n=1 Tax=Thalassobacillus sp. CUG 92003 TaxID=2736641 RepID=UPI0015E7AA52|nr:M15 family metallopeptidase [Thalassobacillus sp. CUG 92003]
MKKWVFFILTIIVMGGALTLLFINNEKIIEEKSGELPETLATEVISKIDVHSGNLVLINEDHPVKQESVQNDIKTFYSENFQDIQLPDQHIQLSHSIAKNFVELVKDAKNDGISNFTITSGYRGIDEQSRLFNEMGEDYALPGGNSEHNAGLSLDVGSTHGTMAHAPEGKWIEDHAWEHGFILRYPENKTDITGIQYEPWHIRYVGLPHSAIMHEKNFVLEEYLTYLKDKKELHINYEGTDYYISYYGENEQIEVPANQAYEISGDNMDGVIVTVSM